MFSGQKCSNTVEGWSYTGWDQFIECLTLAPLFGQCRNEMDRYYYEVCLDCRTKNTMHHFGFYDEKCCGYCIKQIAWQKELWSRPMFKMYEVADK